MFRQIFNLCYLLGGFYKEITRIISHEFMFLNMTYLLTDTQKLPFIVKDRISHLKVNVLHPK